MLKLLYVLLASALLLPGALAAGVTVYMAIRARVEATGHAPGTFFITSHPSRVRVGPLQITFQPRTWAALLVLAGAVLWVVGILYLLFLPGR